MTGKRLSDAHKLALKDGWVQRKRAGHIPPMLNKKHSNKSKEKMVLAKQKHNYWLGKNHSDETKAKMSESWKNTPRDMISVVKSAAEHNRGLKHSEEHNRKISEALKGRTCSDITKSKISQRITGLVRSEETKEKLRILKLQQLSTQGVSRGFNKKACVFMDTFSKENGFCFTHAENGGEAMISGYMVDGYDKEKSIVFEYDEPKHENMKRKEKDMKRTERIIKTISCKVLRYSERYKRFYWSYPDYSEIFISI